MSLSFTTVLGRSCTRLLEDKFLYLSLNCSATQIRERHLVNPRPRLRNPTWFTKKARVESTELLTRENEEFVKEVIQDKYYDQQPVSTVISQKDWSPKIQRTGVIAKKIGVYPLWFKNGEKIQTTLLQVLDNHVIRYYSPEEFEPPRKRSTPISKKKACLLIGAEAEDPSNFTKEYCGLFKHSGVIPKRTLARFFISPEAALPLGTLLTAMHFQVGNVVDVRGKTVDRGFQGVMKRHGFKGMPASHGVTKTHRRGGNIGGGGEKGRVWPGTKMPGHMGNRYRMARGLTIHRINTRYNVLWVSGQAIPGETNSIVYIYDTLLPLRKPTSPVPFPTYLGQTDDSLPEDIFEESIHPFSAPSITYNDQ